MNKKRIMKYQTITVTMQEIWQQTIPKIHKNKKKIY